MTMHVISLHTVANQNLLLNYCLPWGHPLRSASVKQNVYLGKHIIQLLPKSSKKTTKTFLVIAKVHNNDNAERDGIKPDSYDELLDSTLWPSENKHSPREDSSDALDELTPVSEHALYNRLLPIAINIEHSVDHKGNLLEKLKAVHLHLLALEQWNASRLEICHRNYFAGAKNLIHYLALHCLDVQQLNDQLSSVGLLNLDTINPFVLPSISAGIQMLENLKPDLAKSEIMAQGNVARNKKNHENDHQFTINELKSKVSSNSVSLFGNFHGERAVHIMVTVGKEVTHDETFINDLLKAGANVIRINCAHDDPNTWSEIIKIVKHASQMLEKPCRILMDLAGSKLRTGLLSPGPNVLKISPKKDAKGDVITPAQVWLSTPCNAPPSHISPDAVICLDNPQMIHNLEVGDVLRFSDVRGKQRELRISQKLSVFRGQGCIAECSKTSYIGNGTEVYLKVRKTKVAVGQVINVPAAEQFIKIKVGDLLVVSRDPSLSSSEPNGSITTTPRITCSSGRLFDSVKPGDPIAFDDGKIWGVIQGVSINEIVIKIDRANPRGSKLGSEKSINIPKSDMQFEGLTSKDLLDLEFVASNADMVGISFIRDVHDILIVQQELRKRKLDKLGIVLKIETEDAFHKLPLLLLQAMQTPNPLGVMIARGDLAVECGWDRLPYIQEEILSICSAAHIPTIWATQVLESLVKSGVPTRAEITDVANGRRASCIMLNKGKHICQAVTTLDAMLRNKSNEKNMKAELKQLILSNHLI